MSAKTDFEKLLEQPDASWQVAKEYSHTLAPSLPIFATCVRTLLKQLPPAWTHRARADANERAVGLRLLECPSIMVPFYFAGTVFFPDQLKKSHFVCGEQLLDLYSVDEFASILTMLVLHRQASRLAPRRSFDKLSRSLQQALDLGAMIGGAIPEIGAGRGLLTAGIRYLSWSLQLIVDEEAFARYLLRCKMKKEAYDLEQEQSQWGTDFARIGTLLLLSMGFGVDFSYAWYLGITSQQPETLDREALKFRVIGHWLDSLLTRGEPPASNLGDEFMIPDMTYRPLAGKITNLLNHGSQMQWLNARVRDLSPDQKLKLFGHTDDRRFLEYINLPKDVREAFSSEEWHSLADNAQAICSPE